MNTCDWQPLVAAVAALVVAATPGIAAVFVALGNRAKLNALPVKRGTDATDLATIKAQLVDIVAKLPASGAGGGGAGAHT